MSLLDNRVDHNAKHDWLEWKIDRLVFRLSFNHRFHDNVIRNIETYRATNMDHAALE